MNFLQKILKPGKTDPFGIDTAVDGLRQLSSRLADEKSKLECEKNKLRDAALDAPDGDLDEMPVIRQKARIEALEMAYQRALDEAAKQIQGQMPEISKEISGLESEKAKLDRKRDEEALTALRDFLRLSGGRVADLPRAGHGGTLHIPGTLAMTAEDVQAFLGDIPGGDPAPTTISEKIDGIRQRIHKLTMVRHLGPRTGLESLAG